MSHPLCIPRQLLLLPTSFPPLPSRGRSSSSAPLPPAAGWPRRYVPHRCYLRLRASLGRRVTLMVDSLLAFSSGSRITRRRVCRRRRCLRRPFLSAARSFAAPAAACAALCVPRALCSRCGGLIGSWRWLGTGLRGILAFLRCSFDCSVGSSLVGGGGGFGGRGVVGGGGSPPTLSVLVIDSCLFVELTMVGVIV